jgi:magnesium transporter
MTVTEQAGRQLNVEVVEHGELRWLDIMRPSLAEMTYLKERFPFHPLDLEDCLSKIQLPKLDEYPDYLFLVLHFPLFDKAKRLTRPSEMDIFVGANYIVTVHNGELGPLTKLFQDCKLSEPVRHDVMGRSSGWLLYRILDGLVDYCFPILNKVIDSVEAVEDHVFETRRAGTALQELSLIRRDILSYRRIVRPQIDVLQSMKEKEYPFLKVDPEIYFGDLADHMRRLWVDLEDLKEDIEGLHDTFNSLSSHRTGEIIRVVTVGGAIALPAIVIASIYGMNVPLPLQGSAWAFGVILGATAFITVAMLVYSRIRRWL